MSKKYKGKTCVYCCVTTSDTADRVFSKQLFIETRRSDLPIVPACKSCNEEKSKLEHYVTAVLPFGGRHPDATMNLESMVPKRLEKNMPLHASLNRGSRRFWVRKRGLLTRAGALPLVWPKIEQWVVYLVKGLAWHHWTVLIAPDTTIDVIALTPHGERFIQRLFTKPAAERVHEDVGSGTFLYEAAQGIDSPQVSIWRFSLYGGITMAGGFTAPRQTARRIGVYVVPKFTIDQISNDEPGVKAKT